MSNYTTRYYWQGILKKIRGYDQEEVDLFLDKIYFELEELIRYKEETELYIKN